MKEFIKRNFVILLAFILPIGLIIVIFLNSYLPSLFLSTDYNFIYASCGQTADYYPYQCGNYLQKLYSVVNGKLVVNAATSTPDLDKDGLPDVYAARIFLHDTEKNESREITLEEARTLALNGLLTSPDGVTVSSGYDRNPGFPFIFDGGSGYGYYLTKGKRKSKLNFINQGSEYYYRDNFRFIGWILPGRN